MDEKKTSTFEKGRIGRRIVMAITLIMAFVVALPCIVAKSPLLNVLLAQVGANSDLRIEAESAELGWLTPMRLRELSVESKTDDLSLNVEQLQLKQSWLATFLALPDLGSVAIDSPEISVLLPMSPRPSKPAGRPIVGEFVVNDAMFSALAATDGHELIRLEDLDVTIHIDANQTGRTLSVDPVMLLDEVEVSKELCDRGLQLVAPMLANSTSVSGNVSLALHECRVPLADDDSGPSVDQATVAGTLQLHHVQSSMKDSIFRDIAAIVAGLLKRGVPDEIRVADGTEVRFELRNERIYHEGMTFLLPEVSRDMVWRTSGTVGLDDSLDLIVRAQLPFTLIGDGPIARRLTEHPLELHVGGTLDNPKLDLPKDNNWVKQAVGLLVDDQGNADLEPLTDTIIDLFEKARERREAAIESGQPTVLDRMRERLKSNQEKRKRRRQPEETPPTSDDGGRVSI